MCESAWFMNGNLIFFSAVVNCFCFGVVYSGCLFTVYFDYKLGYTLLYLIAL